MEELPDRLRIPDNLGSDNPHLVGMAPVKGDVTITGTPFSVKTQTKQLKRSRFMNNAHAKGIFSDSIFKFCSRNLIVYWHGFGGQWLTWR